MLSWLNNLLGRTTADDDGDWDDEPRRSRGMTRNGGKLELRRWIGAKALPGNKEAYAQVTGRSINSDLHANLNNIMTRCGHEATTNGTIVGMIDSNVIDILGPEGPAILVLPRNPVAMSKQQVEQFAQYQLAAEEYLQLWSECCDVNQEQSFTDILSLEVIASWTTGNSFTQITQKQGAWDQCPGDVRLHPVHAERILSSYAIRSGSDEQVFMGLGLNEYGKAMNYYVQETVPYDQSMATFRAKPVKFQQMTHGFRRTEPGQIAGVPILAPSLDDIASLRTFDKLTLSAAASAASFGVIFEDSWESAKPIKGAANGRTESVKLNGASIMQAPPGRRAKQIASEHPASNYVDFRTERWKDIGRPAQMPKLIARLDASGLSYSAARMEHSAYTRGNRRTQQVIRRRHAPMLSDVLREAELAGAIPFRPVAIEIGMSFTAMPSVDPAKDSKARDLDIKSMSKSLLDVWQETGLRPRDQVDKMRRTVDLLNQVSPGMGERYFEQLIASKPDTIEAAAMAGDELPNDETDEILEELDAKTGEVVEQ